jgi:hypothetical protein
MARTSASVCAPMVEAQWMSRYGVHSRCFWWALGMCSATVETLIKKRRVSPAPNAVALYGHVSSAMRASCSLCLVALFVIVDPRFGVIASTGSDGGASGGEIPTCLATYNGKGWRDD